jgi:hypothetical protein
MPMQLFAGFASAGEAPGAVVRARPFRLLDDLAVVAGLGQQPADVGGPAPGLVSDPPGAPGLG